MKSKNETMASLEVDLLSTAQPRKNEWLIDFVTRIMGKLDDVIHSKYRYGFLNYDFMNLTRYPRNRLTFDKTQVVEPCHITAADVWLSCLNDDDVYNNIYVHFLDGCYTYPANADKAHPMFVPDVAKFSLSETETMIWSCKITVGVPKEGYCPITDSAGHTFTVLYRGDTKSCICYSTCSYNEGEKPLNYDTIRHFLATDDDFIDVAEVKSVKQYYGIRNLLLHLLNNGYRTTKNAMEKNGWMDFVGIPMSDINRDKKRYVGITHTFNTVETEKVVHFLESKL